MTGNVVVVNANTITATVTVKNGGGKQTRIWDLRVGSGVAVQYERFGAFRALEAIITIEAVEKLRADIGIPTRLRDIGVTEDMLPGFAERAFGIKRLMRVNPRVPQTAAEILDIYKAAW